MNVTDICRWTVERCRHAELAATLRAELEAAAQAEFDRFDIVRETTWSKPDWSWLLHAEPDDSLVAFYHLVEREVRIDGATVRIAGLHNLVTLPARRGIGAASWLLRRTQPQWFETGGARLGLLLCADALIPFYARLGWHQTRARVSFAQPDGAHAWKANCMLLDPAQRHGNPAEIDLCGLPW